MARGSRDLDKDEAERLTKLWTEDAQFGTRYSFAARLAQVVNRTTQPSDSQIKAADKRLERLEESETKLTNSTANAIAAAKGISREEFEGRIFLVTPPSKADGAQKEATLRIETDVLTASQIETGSFALRSVKLGGAPVRGGQHLRIQVKLSRPAFLYALWITPTNEVQPIYPWKPRQWGEFASEEEQRLGALELPLGPLRPTIPTWKFESTPGVETLVVMAREEPLPNPARRELQNVLAGLPIQPANAMIEAGPVEFDLCSHSPTGTRLNYREAHLADYIWERHRALSERLAARCGAGRCLSFRNDG